MKKDHNIFIHCFLFLLCINLSSQTRRFQHIISKDGLSQSEVYCFLNDSRGFMWFGTVDGLNRFDGYRIEVFNTEKNNPNALSNNTIRSLAEDKYGRIWIGTDDGLNLYNPKTEIVKQIIPVSVSNQKLIIGSLLVYEDYLFIGTGNGLLRIELKKNINNPSDIDLQRIDFETTVVDESLNVINLKPCSLGGFWMLTTSSVRQLIVEPHSTRAVTVEMPIFNGAYNFLDLVEDDANNLWITSNGRGLLRYNLNLKALSFFEAASSNFGLSSQKCSGISKDKKGNIWIGTLDNGINFIRSEQVNASQIKFEYIKHTPYNPSSLNSNLIRALYTSGDDILWLGTIGSGVNYFDAEQKNFSHLKINSSTSNGSNFIRAVYVNDQNKVWLGTHSNGLYQINRNTNKVKKLGLENKTVFNIVPFQDDKYFICAEDGLYLVKQSNDQIDILSHEKTSATFYIIKGEQDFYWLASFQGLYRLKIQDNRIIIDKNYTLKTSKIGSPENCRVLFYNRKTHELFVGTEGGGLHILSLDNKEDVIADKKYKSNASKGSISNNYIRSIVEDSNGTFWIGTYEGLNKMIFHPTSKAISFQRYTKKDGLPNNMINSIIEDDEKSLWFGTNNGLSKFNPSLNRFLNYFESDGIQSNEFSEHTAFKTDKGEIFMGGINGATSFFPEKITKSQRSPQTTITDFYIDNERINPLQKVGKNVPLKKGITISDTIILLPSQNNIGFNFSSMIYPNVEKIKFSFKLEGFDKNWQYADETTNYANYTNLDYGKYVFNVKSTNSDGIWENKGRKIFIQIKTPFIYTWYAYLLYLIAIILIIVYFSYYSIIRYTTKNKLLLEQEHNKKVQSLNKIRTQFFINISHDLRTPLTLIKGPLESILNDNNLNKDIKEKLLLVRRNVKRLSYLIEQLLDVRRAEKGKLTAKLQEQNIVSFTKKEISYFNYAIKQKGLKFSVFSPASGKVMVGFDSGMLSKVYFNLISNALKYTEKGEIAISIEEVQKKDYEILKDASNNTFVKVEVKDTGRGITKEKLTLVFERFYQEDTTYGKGYGIGLSHTFQLIEAHDGFIEADSEANVGTTIRFYIPMVNNLIPINKIPVTNEDDIYREESHDNLIKETISIHDGAKTLLIVEDNADMRSYIKSALKNDYNVLEAEDGIKGLEMAENFDIDLIVSDIMMPNMDGITYCHHIKTNLKTSHIPVILLTAKTGKKNKYKGIETGADDYISKPFEMEYLILRINNLIQSREQLRKIFQSRDSLIEPSSVTVNSIDEKFLKDLIEAVEEGIPDSGFSVSSLEKILGMSHSNFYRKVKSLTGLSGKELLNDMRMKRAKQILLDNKKIRIDEVAYMVGFTNPRYFGKSFKEVFGISPTEMKRKNIYND